MKRLICLLLALVMTLSMIPVTAMPAFAEEYLIQEETVPEETIPEETIPEETIPEETLPEEILPEETVPEETIPEETIPEETIPEETLPEETVPEETVPEVTIPTRGDTEVTVTASGTCGDDVQWELSSGVLTISGTGAMDDFVLWQQPWAEYEEAIESVNILEGVTTVGAYAFHGYGVTYVSLPQSLTSIGNNAFYGCGLQQIEIPYGVTSIGHSAFYGTGLTSVSIPGSVTTLGTYAFGGCSDLTDVELQPGLETIGKFAFEACESLYWITIPNTVTQILDGAFGYCSSLEEITFGKTAPAIADDAFAGVTATIYYPPDYPAWEALIGKNFGGIITWSCLGMPAPKSGQCGDNVYWTLENGVMTISGAGAMWINQDSDPWWLTNPELVTSVVIEEGVTTVGYMAFADHGNITSVRFPTTLTTIAPGAFNGCPIETVTIPAGVTQIGDYAFWCVPSSHLKAVTVQGNPAIGANAFGGAEADMITFTGDAPTFHSDAFYGTTSYISYPADNATWNDLVGNHYGGTLIWCPDGVKPVRPTPETVEELASGTSGECKWVLYTDGKLVISSINDLPAYLSFDAVPWYEYRTEIWEVVIGDHVTGIENGNLFYLPLVESITFSEYVNHISSLAFSGATRNLHTVYFEGDPPDISADAFVGVTADVFRRSDNFHWEGIEDQNYGGNLNWQSYGNPAIGEQFVDGDWGCSVVDGQLTITYYYGQDTDVTIPAEIRGYPVTGIGERAFVAHNMTSVYIPEGVTTIGAEAFVSCQNLIEITVPDSVTDIGERAFSNCKKLTGIYIPEGISRIEEGTFDGCNKLTKVAIPDSVTDIGERAFYGCSSLTDIVIPEGVTCISNALFYGCNSLNSVVIPENVTSIGDYAFNGCNSLTRIIIPDSVTSIGRGAFYGAGLRKITIPDSVTHIDEYTFYGCGALLKITLPQNLVSIGAGAFKSCRSLKDIQIPETVECIGDEAFYYCRGLDTIVFTGDAPEFVGDAVFGSIFVNEPVNAIAYYPADNATWTNGVMRNYGGQIVWTAYRNTPGDMCAHTVTFLQDAVASTCAQEGYTGTTVCAGCGATIKRGTAIPVNTYHYYQNGICAVCGIEATGMVANGECGEGITWELYNDNILILSGVGDMDDYKEKTAPWYDHRESIQTVIVNEGVTSVGDYAFFNCNNLRTVVFPEGLRSIGNSAFRSCYGMEFFTFPESLESIGAYAFYDHSFMPELTIPAKVTSIGTKAFAKLDSRNIRINFTGDAPAFGSDIFDNSIFRAYYPASNTTWTSSVRKLYGGDSEYSNWYGEGGPEDDFFVKDSCGKNARCVLTKDGTLTISGTGAIGGFLDSYDAPWAKYLDKVRKVVIEEGITQISNSCFYGCVNMTEVTIPSTVKTIGDFAFEGCSMLTGSLELPSGIKTISYGAFAGCAGLTEIKLGKNVTTIENKAFSGCTNLCAITIPATVTKIGREAFSDCVSLTEVVFEGKAPEIAKKHTNYGGSFEGVMATVYYPSDHSGWKNVIDQNYGGLLTWVHYCSHSDANIVNAEKPTCTETGYSGDLLCPDCGNTLLGEVIPATGHSYGAWYVEVPNRYMENGEEHRDCKDCNHYESRVLEFVFILDQVQNVRVSSKKTSVKLSYDKVAGANRYEIWVDGEYVSSTSSTSYTVEDLTCGVNYEFMVVARDSEDGNYLYGPGSEVVVARPYNDLDNGYKASLSETELIYDGTSKTPEVAVKKSSSGKHGLTEGTDYTVTYENNVAIGTATVTVIGIGQYGGTITKSFEILPDQVQNLQVEVVSEDTLHLTFDPVPGATEYWIYRSGSRIAKIAETSYTVTGLKAGKSYKLSVKANTVVDGDNYTGEEIQSNSAKPVYTMDGYTVSLKYTDRAYTGKSRTNTVTVISDSGKKLTKDTDYTVSYENNKDVGTATVIVTGKGKYSGTLTTTFDIVPAQVSKPKAVVEQLENGSAIYVTFKTVPQAVWFNIYLNGELYTATEELGHFTEYLEPGAYSVTVRAGVTIDGKDYIGEASDPVKITVRKTVEYCTAQLSEYEFVYTGKAHKPDVTVYGYDGEVLTEGVDYTLSYKNNKSTGRGYVEIKGKGNYNGSIKEYFTVSPAQVTGLKVSSTTKTSVKISFDKDSTNSTKYYNVYVNGRYEGRTTGSSYTIKNLTLGEVYSVYVVPEKTVSKQTYYGQPSEILEVWPGTGIGSYKVTLEYTSVTFTGEDIEPSVTVKTSSKSSAKVLVKDVDYKVIYDNNVGPGKAKVTIQGIGVYTGTITKTFKINPPKVENVTATAASNTSIEVSFDAAPGATSYWVYVGGSRKAKITDTTCVIKGLKKNKTYKITVKAVATVDGTNYTSDYTDPVSCKTVFVPAE